MRRALMNFSAPDGFDLLGITGNAASGKDYVSQQIAERGYILVSSSDILREEIVNRGQTPGREIQTKIANELREVYGVDILVKLALKRALSVSRDTDCNGILISGIYAPGEGAAIKDLGGRLIEVIADVNDSPRLRFERLKKRQDGPRDDIDYTAFLAAFLRENSGKYPYEANVSKVASLADIHIINDGDAHGLRQQIDNISKG